MVINMLHKNLGTVKMKPIGIPKYRCPKEQESVEFLTNLDSYDIKETLIINVKKRRYVPQLLGYIFRNLKRNYLDVTWGYSVYETSGLVVQLGNKRVIIHPLEDD